MEVRSEALGPCRLFGLSQAHLVYETQGHPLPSDFVSSPACTRCRGSISTPTPIIEHFHIHFHPMIFTSPYFYIFIEPSRFARICGLTPSKINHFVHSQESCLFQPNKSLLAIEISGSTRCLLAQARTVFNDEKARATVMLKVVLPRIFMSSIL